MPLKIFSSLIFELLLCAAFLSIAGCTPPPFPLLKPSEGWVQLAQPPSEEKEILAAADDDFRAKYSNSGNEITWFRKSDSEYLIYVRNKWLYQVFAEDGMYDCGDSTYDFKKVTGVWMLPPRSGLGKICVD